MPAYRRPVSHVIHALLTLLTGGLWAVVWGVVRAVVWGVVWGMVWVVTVLVRGEDRVRLEPDARCRTPGATSGHVRS